MPERCGGCPFAAGGCVSCPMRARTKEVVSSDIQFSSLKALTENFKGLLPKGTILFNRIGEPLMRLQVEIRKSICSACRRDGATTCSHQGLQAA